MTNICLMTIKIPLTLFFLVALAPISTCSAQTTVQTIALFSGKAMLSVNGKKAKIIEEGQTYEGVRLISANTDQIEVELDGRRETLTLNSTVILSDSLGTQVPPATSVQVWADQDGFFRSDGEINGRGIEFLVDTGASMVVLSGEQADRIGLEYRDGLRTFAATASGTSPMYAIQLDNISFGGIELNNINAGVIEGSFPIIPLLGMTFLNRLDMTRSGNLMELKKR